MHRAKHNWNLTLSLSSKVVFVDWDGVLSKMRFWDDYSVSGSGATDLDVQVAVHDLFTDSDVIADWMVGKVLTPQVVREHLLRRLPEARVDDMHRYVVEQCATASMSDAWLLGALAQLKASHQLVLATDNMDCFTDGVVLRSDLSRLFDDYISSAEVGVLKAESPERFFGTWLTQRGVDAADSTLIDDSAQNCAAFERLGGRSICFGSMTSRADVIELLWPR